MRRSGPATGVDDASLDDVDRSTSDPVDLAPG
jgi:hypothetical protein